MVDALALGAEEGRDKLRKATGSCKWTVIRRYPNAGTHLYESIGIITWKHSVMRGTWGTETSKYPKEKKSNEIPRVVASESGGG